MTQQELKEYIIARIYPNNAQEITGEALQSVLLEIVENAENKEEALATIEEIRQEIATKANKSVVDDLEQNKVDKVEGKGLSTNDYSNVDKALVDSIPTLTTNVDNIGQTLADVEYEINKKADTDGYYPKMSVGMADNLVGRGDVQDALINFRPSGGVLGVGNGMNITDGAARIERIKGNSVVYNQIWKNVQGKWANTRTESILTDRGVKITATGEYAKSFKTGYAPFTVGHKVAITLMAKVKGKILLGAYQGATADQAYLGILEGDGESWKEYSFVQSTVTVKTFGIFIQYAGDSIEIDENRVRIADMTKMFGVGNAPTTVEEYYQHKPMNIEDEFAYNDGELIDMKVDSLISTSDNAYDYTKGYARVMGGHTYDCSYGTTFVEKVYFSTDKDNIVAEENAMTSENGEYTFPSDGYAVPYTTDGDVREYCVCLQHSYDKPHPPYQEEVKNLSFIGEAFPEGMRSAGSVFDEIRFNKTTKVWEKVVRVGVRAYAEGDTEDNSVMTDGTTTNYPLANPTPTPIDLSPNFNPNYLAWDFGTEEAIASVPSTPFRADVNYEPNAVDDLRWAVAEIRSLRAQLAQLQSTQVSDINLME